MNELIRKVRFLDPLNNIDQVTDVWLADGKIKQIGGVIKEVPSTTTQIDGEGLVLAPGLVDLYSSSGEPGYEERENLASLQASATAGGFTRLNILPNTMPTVDNPGTLSLFKQYANQMQVWGALTKGTKGEQMTELGELAQAGVVGFTDGRGITNLGLLQRLLEYVQPLGKPVALMAVNPKLQGNGVMREGKLSISCGLPGDPVISEASTIAAILEMVAGIGTPVHFMRVSTARGVELIAQGKAQGLPITASTTWLHLLLDTTAVSRSYDPNLRVNPPLGNPVDLVALQLGVKEGVLDGIAIDHTPYTYEENTVAFAQSPPGVIGLELALPLLWSSFVETGAWSALTLWKALSTNPSHCLHQPAISCQEGEKAELVLFDPHYSWTVTSATLKSLSQNTFWYKQTLQGQVLQVWQS